MKSEYKLLKDSILKIFTEEMRIRRILENAGKNIPADLKNKILKDMESNNLLSAYMDIKKQSA